MSQNLQKSAKPEFTEKLHFREGILNPAEFARNYELHCYEPSNEMEPFVEHYFISRRRLDFDREYEGHDVLSQPVVSLFVQPSGAFFQGPTTGKRTLRARDAPIYAGAQFKPGGFYPFWQSKVSYLTERTIPATEVISEADRYLNSTLLAAGNETILRTIDTVLHARQPKYDANVGLVNRIVDYVQTENRTATVVSVARHFGTSERSLQHLFQTYVGVGVKWAIMRARFLEIAKYARAQAKPDWLAVALEFGYADQSHFIN
ncbi:MAG TPA: AraC family transcriptional regulator, partial [Candidatus Saccharimonadales bacterium]|nr:AraC family transcriptional regulator [Candidatus Saccharimonadales bacterium]